MLDHAVDAHLRRIHRDAGLVVVEALPARAEPDLEPTLGQLVDRRQLAREHRGMAEVAVEHERPDVERRGDGGRGRHRGDRSEALVEVIGHEHRRVAERLELADRVGPRPVVEGPVQFGGETERVGGHRGESRRASRTRG